MLHILICDQDEVFCQKLYIMLKEIEQSIGQSFCIKEVFYTEKSFYRFLKDGNRIDLVFLDTEISRRSIGQTGQQFGENIEIGMEKIWNGLSGVEFGKRIQKEFGEEMMIVYLIANKYAHELSWNHSQNLLQKPIHKQEVEKALKETLHCHSDLNDRFEFVCDGVHHLIWRREILYLRSEKKRVEIVTFQRSYWIYQKLSNVEHMLSDQNFLRAHQSYLVNSNAVTMYGYKNLRMINGDVVPISKIYQKKTHCFFLEQVKKET